MQADGAITIGSLSLTVLPDIYTAGLGEMTQLNSYLLDPQPYAENLLSLLVPAGTPRGITGFSDLTQPDLRLATEGIARLAQEALRRAVDDPQSTTVFHTKVSEGTTLLTTVHHRETIAWLSTSVADVCVVWQGETTFAIQQGYAVETVPLDVCQHGRPILGRRYQKCAAP